MHSTTRVVSHLEAGARPSVHRPPLMPRAEGAVIFCPRELLEMGNAVTPLVGHQTRHSCAACPSSQCDAMSVGSLTMLAPRGCRSLVRVFPQW